MIKEIIEVPAFKASFDHQVILDKVDSAWGIRGSWQIGMQMPIPAVAGIKASDRFQSESNKYEQPDTRGGEK
jgi:hypothetical protein